MRTLSQRALTNARTSVVGRRINQSWWSTLPTPIGSLTSAVTVTADTAAHTKGAWAELIASTSDDADVLLVNVAGVVTNGADTASLIDIGIGAAASEVVVIPDVAVGGASTNPGTNGIWFAVPLFIRKGSRIAARMQSVVTLGKTGTVQVWLARSAAMQASRAPSSVTTYGTSTATSVGVAINSTSYTQIVASTSARLSAIVAVPSVSSSSTGAATPYYGFTIAVGAAGSEVDIGFVGLQSSSGEAGFVVGFGFMNIFPLDVPAGVRLSAKAAAANNGSYDLCLIGIPRIA